MNAAVRKMAASCADSAARGERKDLLRGEDVDIAAAGQGRLLDLAHGVLSQAIDLAGALEDPVQDDECLPARAWLDVEAREPLLNLGDAS
ncbi:MAG: hypothetical protein M3065_18200 [Actinomycetota bacterium]|nr:hypothetical protein [Actinomycetota bacterium]